MNTKPADEVSDDICQWPSPYDIGGLDVEETEYPLSKAAMLEATTYTELEVMGIWEDDHEPCLGIRAVTDKGAEVYFARLYCNAKYWYLREDDIEKTGAKVCQDMKDEILSVKE